MKRELPLGITSLVFLLILLASAVFLRTVNLDWGSPYYFHPDERNIASAVTRLNFPDEMNPDFFAYGSSTIYVIYFLGVLFNSILPSASSPENLMSVSFEQAIIVSRILSVVYSLLTLVLIYSISRKMHSNMGAFLALTLGVFSIGFIQFAHFGTVESALSFYAVLLCWLLLRYIATSRLRYMTGAFIIAGIATSIKVSSVFLFPLPILVFMITGLNTSQKRTIRTLLPILYRGIIGSIVLLLTAAGIFLITSPYTLIDWQSFRGSMNYESGVATGTIPVFYTGEFFNKIPVLYQIFAIYPFILNPVVSIIALPLLIFFGIKSFSQHNSYNLLILSFFVVLFFSQAFLFTKWTRYIIPTLPFLYIIIGIMLATFYQSIVRKNIALITISIIILSSIIWSISYIITVYIEKDTRVLAAEYMKEHIPRDAKIASDIFDLGVIAFEPHHTNVTLIDFYALEHDSLLPETIRRQLIEYQYYVLPSQRIINTRLMNPEVFPHGHALYDDLINERLGFVKIYQTPCSVFCKITYLADPVNMYEQTAMVFDRPTVIIYKNLNTQYVEH